MLSLRKGPAIRCLRTIVPTLNPEGLARLGCSCVARLPWGEAFSGSVILCFALVLIGCGHPQATGSAEGFNLLLITIDTVRADHVGAWGYREAETANMDALAAAGVRLADVSTPVPLTTPAHASILTGLLPPHHGIRTNGGDRLDDTTPDLATILGAAGYRTGAFIGASVLDHRFGLARGFATYDDEIPFDPHAGLDAERPGRVVADRALAWLGQESSRPFFAWIHLYDAHTPYRPPEPYRTRFAAHSYDGEIAEVDHQIGRLLEWLQQSRNASRTVVVIAADHGEGLGDHGELTHGLLLYQSCLHVPVIIRASGVLPTGFVVEAPLSLVDLAPTLLSLLQVPAPEDREGFDGHDIFEALIARREPAGENVYAESRYAENFGWSPIAVLRRGRLKYIAAPKPELYDLKSDPNEDRNLLPGRSADADKLAEALAVLGSGEVVSHKADLDPEARARLQSLGYLGGEGVKARGAHAQDPKDMVALLQTYDKAQSALHAGDVDQSRSLLEEIVAADPDNPLFLGELAKACHRAGDLDQAITLLRRSVDLALDSRSLRYNLAVTLLEAGHTDQALDELRKVVALEPYRADARNALGMALAVTNDLDGAREQLEEATRLDPNDPRILNNLGDVLRGAGRFQDSERAYRRAIAIDSDYADPWYGLGTLYLQQKHPTEALPCFDRALAIHPGLHRARLNRGLAAELIGNRAEAIAAYRDFLARTSGDSRYAAQASMARRLLVHLEQNPNGP